MHSEVSEASGEEPRVKVKRSARFPSSGPDSVHNRGGILGKNIVLERNTLQRGLSLLSLSHWRSVGERLWER